MRVYSPFCDKHLLPSRDLWGNYSQIRRPGWQTHSTTKSPGFESQNKLCQLPSRGNPSGFVVNPSALTRTLSVRPSLQGEKDHLWTRWEIISTASKWHCYSETCALIVRSDRQSPPCNSCKMTNKATLLKCSCLCEVAPRSFQSEPFWTPCFITRKM